MKEVAPSTALRRWYGHDPRRWQRFAERYRRELAEPERAAAIAELRRLAAAGGLVLLTATRDVARSAAQVLAETVREPTGPGAGPRAAGPPRTD